MKFIMAYSGGKDCSLAMDRMIRDGHELVAICSTFGGRNLNFNLNHGIHRNDYLKYADALEVEAVCGLLTSLRDKDEMHRMLAEVAARTGAEALCTGDIYAEDPRAWDQQLADDLGLRLFRPLWGEPPEILMDELLDRGFIAYVKAVETDRLSADFLGKRITRELLDAFKAEGIDISGERGEYHSIVTDGPIFKHPLEITFGSKVVIEHEAMINAHLA